MAIVATTTYAGVGHNSSYSAQPIPRAHRALVATGPGAVALKVVPVPRLAPDEVLVHVAAVALNPSDHKLLDQSTTVGAVSGADLAGVVVRLGTTSSRQSSSSKANDADGDNDDQEQEEEAVSSYKHKLKVGDRVLAFVFGANPGNPGNGAFAQYAAVPAGLCVRIPENNFDKYDFASAASLAMGTLTAGLIFRELGLDLDLDMDDRYSVSVSRSKSSQLTPLPPSRATGAKKGDLVLVHGGASATGTLLLQLLRMSGYVPLAVCSTRNFELARGRGAAATFDYASPTVRDEIRDYVHAHYPADRPLRLALDCFGTPETMTLCCGVLDQHATAGTGASYYVALDEYPNQLAIRRRHVDHSWILGWTSIGKEVKLAGTYYRPPGEGVRKDREYIEAWCTHMEEVLRRGLLEPHPLEVVRAETGAGASALSTIIPKLDELRKGKVRGQKIAIQFWG